jgi:hypothetical protein
MRQIRIESYYFIIFLFDPNSIHLNLSQQILTCIRSNRVTDRPDLNREK